MNGQLDNQAGATIGGGNGGNGGNGVVDACERRRVGQRRRWRQCRECRGHGCAGVQRRQPGRRQWRRRRQQHRCRVGTAGAAGVGVDVAGDGNSVVNAGSISGGLGGDGVTRGNAVAIAGNNNTLELQSGYGFTGNAVATGTGNAFALGGSTDAAFDTSAIGNQYQGFTDFRKTGASTWTLERHPVRRHAVDREGRHPVHRQRCEPRRPGRRADPRRRCAADHGRHRHHAPDQSRRGGGTLRTDAGTTLSLGTGMTGAGDLAKEGAGTLRAVGRQQLRRRDQHQRRHRARRRGQHAERRQRPHGRGGRHAGPRRLQPDGGVACQRRHREPAGHRARHHADRDRPLRRQQRRAAPGHHARRQQQSRPIACVLSGATAVASGIDLGAGHQPRRPRRADHRQRHRSHRHGQRRQHRRQRVHAGRRPRRRGCVRVPAEHHGQRRLPALRRGGAAAGAACAGRLHPRRRLHLRRRPRLHLRRLPADVVKQRGPRAVRPP